ncbi:MAG: glycosyltransferase family protein, partial [Lachnospiraceae bacterium]|nr:glycosyltransferase family protein [Lachnospiraceae bacterium]
MKITTETKEMLQMNDKKFTFIISVTNDLYLEECQYYIDKLVIPEAYVIDLLTIREADSMCAAYNAGMQASDAKYKVYMHQDVFIRNEEFLLKVLEIFEADETIGMIGMTGGTNIPDTGIVFDTWNVGKVDVREPDIAYFMHTDDSITDNREVCAIDGMIMVTQYDILWREDIFTHFDFYDIAQSCEFRRAGYKVVVPYQEIPWVIHDCGFAKLKNYGEESALFLKEYASFVTCEGKRELVYDEEWEQLSQLLEVQLMQMLEAGLWKDAESALKIYHQANYKSSNLEVINNIVMIHNAELIFFEGLSAFEEMREMYYRVRFALRRMELAEDAVEYADVAEAIAKKELSFEVLLVFLKHAVVDKKTLLQRVMGVYEKCGNAFLRG